MQVIDLSGKWKCYSADGSVNTFVNLPGSSCEAGIGKKQEYYNEYSREAVRAPKERYEYIGELIYEREFDIPAEYEGKDIYLYFERINIASKAMLDGIALGRGVIALSTPHIYRLSDRYPLGRKLVKQGEFLFPSLAGHHTLQLHIDNSDLLNIGDMASGYSIDTQGYWNGAIGKLELRIDEPCNIEQVQVFPDKTALNHLHIKTITLSDRHVPMGNRNAMLEYDIISPDGVKLAHKRQLIELFSRRQSNHTYIEIPEDKLSLWSEFNPVQYKVVVTLTSDVPEKDIRCKVTFEQLFGIRKLSVENKQFMLNDRPLSLRGTINCAQYPLTGYPPMDVTTWKKHFSTFREWGLNHVRFHAWCPPEAAFVAADELGIYLSVEMPLWLNRDVTPMEFGDDEWQTTYFRSEALRLSENYGNHPSFCFFSNGNENLGDYAMLETMIEETKAHDDRRLYTMTSNFDHPISPAEDYISAFEILHYKARIQDLQDLVGESTSLNYDKMAEAVPVPFASFEVGQYCVYPDVDICDKYTGNILPVNFDIVRKMMKEHDVYKKLDRYVKASGDLAAKLYKEDIEAVLRTRGMGGFQLLSLVDYTGQSTATVGMLDIFHESKNVISASDWKDFCCEVVPLFEANRIFTNNETLNGFISLYDFGETPIEKPHYTLEFIDGTILRTLEFDGARGEKLEISVPLDFIKKNTLVKVRLSVVASDAVVPDAADSNIDCSVKKKVYKNTWRIFVFDKAGKASSAVYVRTPEELDKAAANGGKIIALPGAFKDAHFADNSFIPVFWSPVHFPSEKPCGAMIEASHPALSAFPTEKYPDYQWKYLMEHSVSMDISKLPSDSDIIIEMVPNYVDNVPKSPLFITTVGKATVLFCGFDLDSDNVTVQAFKKSIEEYMK